MFTLFPTLSINSLPYLHQIKQKKKKSIRNPELQKSKKEKKWQTELTQWEEY